ncbi:MAG: hypothetical protein JXA01_01620 [Dehalococcoidia bacterium]|nr:hypothetical protein [Dehalococcoidia bacterium]
MKTSGRFLIAFGIFIVVLVAVAIVIAIVGGNEAVTMLPEDSPEGTVQRFLMSVQERDYVKAYSYLSPESGEGPLKDPYNNWLGSTRSYRDSSTWKAAILKFTAGDNSATVEVAVDVFRPGGLFEDPVDTHYVTFLLQVENGRWMIKSPIDLYWLY